MEIKAQQVDEANKSKKEYRDAILFEEILRNEKIIPLYDCVGKVFRHELMKNIVYILFGAGAFYYFFSDPTTKPKRKSFNCGISLAFVATRLLFYRRFQKSFVDKVVYDTTTKLVTLTKRSLFGSNFEQTVNPGMLLFTNDKALNKRNINYINMENLDTY